MFLSKKLSDQIVSTSVEYLGREFCFDTFNCVHFVREVYSRVGINFPMLVRDKFPPLEFHLDVERFEEMPIGHSVFFKRKNSRLTHRSWSHIAIVVGPNELIHCTRNLGASVVITPKPIFLEAYDLTIKDS